jgi:hypothetical protein
MARSGGRVKATFKPDHKAFTEFATSDQMLEPLLKAAHDVRAAAELSAAKKTGSYASGFKVDAAAGTLMIGTYKRRITAVVNEDPAAAPEEFGGRRNKANHTLAKAGALIGDFRGGTIDD